MSRPEIKDTVIKIPTPSFMKGEKHGGRELWAPLVALKESGRDELVKRSGLDILPHSSMECFPCVCSNKSDLMRLDEKRITKIEIIEDEMGFTKNGKKRTLFRPYRQMGAVGIREAHRWAKSPRGKFKKDQPELELKGGCSSGYCGN